MADGVGGEGAVLGFVAEGYAGLLGPVDDASIDLAVLDVEDGVVEGAAVGEVIEEFGRGFVDEDVTIFVAFAVADEDFLLLEAEVGEAPFFEFGASAAGGVEKADDDVIALVYFFDGGEEFEHFLAADDGGEAEADEVFALEFVEDFLGALAFYGAELAGTAARARLRGGAAKLWGAGGEEKAEGVVVIGLEDAVLEFEGDLL